MKLCYCETRKTVNNRLKDLWNAVSLWKANQVWENWTPNLGRVLLESTISGWMGWLGFLCSIGKPFLVGLVEMVGKAFAWLCRVTVACIRTISRSFLVWTENGWKSVLLRKVNLINPNWLQMKRLIPTEHDHGLWFRCLLICPEFDCMWLLSMQFTIQLYDSHSKPWIMIMDWPERLSLWLMTIDNLVHIQRFHLDLHLLFFSDLRWNGSNNSSIGEGTWSGNLRSIYRK